MGRIGLVENRSTQDFRSLVKLRVLVPSRRDASTEACEGVGREFRWCSSPAALTCLLQTRIELTASQYAPFTLEAILARA
jgi:hypothetical protein